MNFERILNMVINQIVRRGVNEGINRGIGAMSRKGKRPEDMTPEEREQAKHVQGQAKSARRLLRQTRRFTRF